MMQSTSHAIDLRTAVRSAATSLVESRLKSGRRRATPTPPEYDGFTHTELVALVRRKAAEIGVDVPVRAFGEQPKIVFYEPSGQSRHLYQDLTSLEAATERGWTTPATSGVATDTPTVHQWSAAQLCRWLADPTLVA